MIVGQGHRSSRLGESRGSCALCASARPLKWLGLRKGMRYSGVTTLIQDAKGEAAGERSVTPRAGKMPLCLVQESKFPMSASAP